MLPSTTVLCRVMRWNRGLRTLVTATVLLPVFSMVKYPANAVAVGGAARIHALVMRKCPLFPSSPGASPAVQATNATAMTAASTIPLQPTSRAFKMPNRLRLQPARLMARIAL